MGWRFRQQRYMNWQWRTQRPEVFEVEALSAIPVQSLPNAGEDKQWVKEADDRLTAYRRGAIQAVTLSEAIAKHRVGGWAGFATFLVAAPALSMGLKPNLA